MRCDSHIYKIFRKTLIHVSRLARIYQADEDEKLLRNALRTLGTNVTLSEIEVATPNRVSIGDHIYIGPKTQLHGIGYITIKDYSIISSEVYILSSIHNHVEQFASMIPYDEIEIVKHVTIGIACWIGARAIIMPGVDLGDGCIVGAGAVVTKSWPSGAILAGVPAKLIRQRDMQHFNTCVENQEFYVLQKSIRGLEKIEKAFTL